MKKTVLKLMCALGIIAMAPACGNSGQKQNKEKEEKTMAFDASTLDGQYTVFGETLSGFDVIDKIAAVQTDGRDKPVKDIHIISIRPEVKVQAPAETAVGTEAAVEE